MPADPDKEVKKNPTYFPSLAWWFHLLLACEMCCLKLPCFEFSVCLSPAHLQANVTSSTVHTPRTSLSKFYGANCSKMLALGHATHRISTWRTGWQEKSTDTKKLMSTRWYTLAGIAQCLTLSPFKGEQGLITGPEPLKWAYPARRITLALLFLAGLQSAGTDLE